MNWITFAEGFGSGVCFMVGGIIAVASITWRNRIGIMKKIMRNVMTK